MPLTGMKLAFAKARRSGMSNKDAAIAAGYSAKTASPAGSRLAKDKDVQAYIARVDKVASEKPAKKPRRKAAPNPADGLPDVDPLENHDDPKDFLLAAMKNPLLDPRQRIDAAKAALPYCHQKIGESGKKEQKQDAAKKVAGRFAAGTPPKLVAAGGKKI